MCMTFFLQVNTKMFLKKFISVSPYNASGWTLQVDTSKIKQSEHGGNPYGPSWWVSVFWSVNDRCVCVRKILIFKTFTLQTIASVWLSNMGSWVHAWHEHQQFVSMFWSSSKKWCRITEDRHFTTCWCQVWTHEHTFDNWLKVMLYGVKSVKYY